MLAAGAENLDAEVEDGAYDSAEVWGAAEDGAEEEEAGVADDSAEVWGAAEDGAEEKEAGVADDLAEVRGEEEPVITWGGTQVSGKCNFPFMYKDTKYEKYTMVDSVFPWCATTPDFGKDQEWGYCLPSQMKPGPRGPMGPRGPQGPQGPTGPKGQVLDRTVEGDVVIHGDLKVTGKIKSNSMHTLMQ